MDIKQFQAITPIAAAVLLGAALFGVLLSIRLFRKSRTDSYWRFRRAAGKRGGRLFMLSLFMAFMSALICAGGNAVGWIQRAQATSPPSTSTPLELVRPTPTTASLTPAPSLTATLFVPTSAPLATNLPTETVTATLLPSSTASATRTSTATLVLTDSPAPLNPSPLPPTPGLMVTESSLTTTASPSMTLIGATSVSVSSTAASPTAAGTIRATALQSSVTPPADATLQITALDKDISGSLAPINPATTFTAGFKRIYFFVSYSGMQSGVLWRGSLLKNGALINHFERLWGTTTSGMAYFFFGDEAGFSAGDYEIRLYLGAGSTPNTSAAFKVVPAP